MSFHDEEKIRLDNGAEPLAGESFNSSTTVWSITEWNHYLKTIELPLAEKQVESDRYDRLASIQSESVFSFAQESASPELYARLQNALCALTKQQYATIDILFFQMKSHREAARELSISQSRIRDLKQQALKNLKTLLQGGALTSPLVDKKKENENV